MSTFKVSVAIMFYFQTKASASKTDPIKEHLNKVVDRYAKFTAAEGQAKESNTRLHEALAEHLKTLNILTLTPEEIEATLPNANDLITGKLTLYLNNYC